MSMMGDKAARAAFEDERNSQPQTGDDPAILSEKIPLERHIKVYAFLHTIATQINPQDDLAQDAARISFNVLQALCHTYMVDHTEDDLKGIFDDINIKIEMAKDGETKTPEIG